MGAETQKVYSKAVLKPNKKPLDQQVDPNLALSFSKIFLIVGFSVQGTCKASIEHVHTH